MVLAHLAGVKRVSLIHPRHQASCYPDAPNERGNLNFQARAPSPRRLASRARGH